MATYSEIQNYIAAKYGFLAQTCWIAHVKADNGLTTRPAPNRINPSKRAKPCPYERRKAIEEALKHFRMI
jgi:hypothetical protein